MSCVSKVACSCEPSDHTNHIVLATWSANDVEHKAKLMSWGRPVGNRGWRPRPDADP